MNLVVVIDVVIVDVGVEVDDDLMISSLLMTKVEEDADGDVEVVVRCTCRSYCP